MITEMILKHIVPQHGSPQDRGSADRYYGRPFCPHYWPHGSYHGTMIIENEMTSGAIEAYKYGWDNCHDRKSWK